MNRVPASPSHALFLSHSVDTQPPPPHTHIQQWQLAQDSGGCHRSCSSSRSRGTWCRSSTAIPNSQSPCWTSGSRSYRATMSSICASSAASAIPSGPAPNCKRVCSTIRKTWMRLPSRLRPHRPTLVAFLSRCCCLYVCVYVYVGVYTYVDCVYQVALCLAPGSWLPLSLCRVGIYICIGISSMVYIYIHIYLFV